MKHLLILGAYGFIGSNILKYIDEHCLGEFSVVTFDKFEKHPAGLTFDCVYRSYAGDFSDSVLIESIFKENSIDIVIHSISTTIPISSYNSKYDVQSNVIPTLDLLQCMLENGVKDIVYFSSGGAIYGDKVQKNHVESEDVFPISSYGVVKLVIEKYLLQYARQFGLRPLVLRLSNPYGKYHYSMKQGICNVALRKALDHEPLPIYGDGTASKDYVYVEDVVRILFMLLDQHVCGEVINLGSGQTYSVNEIAESIKKLVPSFEWSYQQASQLDVTHTGLDISKLRKYVGNYAFVDLPEGLCNIYEWEKYR